MNVDFHSCIHDWCFQKGMKEQYMRCKEASEDGRTCYNPTIRYGSTTGGRPAKHPYNDIAGWCQQLFPTSIYGGTATYKLVKGNHKGWGDYFGAPYMMKQIHIGVIVKMENGRIQPLMQDLVPVGMVIC